MLAALPEEEEAEEVSDKAGLDFAKQVVAALHTIVNVGYRHGNAGEPTEVQRRSLIDLCVSWGKTDGWAKLRSYNIWTCKNAGRVCVALRSELFGQLGLPKMTQNTFGRLCEHYELGTRQDKVCGQRAVVLSPKFLADRMGLRDQGIDPRDDFRDDAGFPNGASREGKSSNRPDGGKDNAI
jgi:hypothetical protein